MARNKYDVFISHTDKDKPFARQLAEALKIKGFNTWTDMDTRPGEKWANQVEKALRESKVFLLLLSPDFLSSQWTNFELGVALSRAASSDDTYIIPVATKGVTKRSLPKILRDLHVIDAKDISSRQAAEKVVKAVESLPAAKG